jgi:hypothetical protein
MGGGMVKKRPPSTTRVVGYRFGGDIDYEPVMKLLARALDRGVITQFDGNKSCECGRDVVWFNGPPGRPLRDLRNAVSKLVKD